MRLRNAGNTLLDVTGAYGVKHQFGIGVGNEDLPVPLALVPGAEPEVRLAWPDALLGGPYRADLRLDYEGGRSATGSVSFFVTPGWELFVALLLLLLLVGSLVWARRRRRRSTA